jgi:hypothetical protein
VGTSLNQLGSTGPTKRLAGGMGGIRTVRGQSAVDMDSFPAFSGEIKGGGSVLVFAVTTASKAAKKLDRLHFHGLPKLRRNMSLGKLLAQLAGTALSNTVWSIRTVRTVLAFALLVILMRQTREDSRPLYLTAVIKNMSSLSEKLLRILLLSDAD